MSHRWTVSPSHALRVGPGFELSTLDPAATPGWDGGRKSAQKETARVGEELSELQEKLWAHGRTGGARALLLVLQGLDTAGKGGIVRHVVGMVDPQGVQITSFGRPTEEELAHHYLWRIRRALPRPGRIGVFDRSHYEDVLVVRVDELVPQEVWEPRYEEINAFEQEIVESGTVLVKVALVISSVEQRARLRERLQRPDKHWKYNPGDIDVRARWDAYQEAYQAVFDRTSTESAPWYAVPADNKWYARLAVAQLLKEALEGLRLDWPAADFDPAAEMERLERS
jgi:polyphosphate:nucleotide phosphotransferase, PPK2 family